MQVQVNKKDFYELAKRIFMDIAEIKKGYPVIIPISNHHIYINDIICFLDDDAKHYLSFNSYGQMDIIREKENGARENHIGFNLKNLTSLRFHAQNFGGEVNEKNGRYYNESFSFSF